MENRALLEQAEYTTMAALEEGHWWWRARREILADVIERHVPSPAAGPVRVAEVGCGTGGNLPMLARFGEVLGAEHEPAALEHLRRKHGTTFNVIQHTVPQPLPGRFHILGMFDVLEHIEDDARALTWVSDQLEPGGIAVLTVPAFQFLWTEHDEAAHHFRRYTPATLRAVVPETLEVVHLTCFNALLFAPIAAVRAAMRLLPRRKGGPPRSQVGKTPEPLNWLLYQLFRLERHVVPRYRSPVGVSVLAVLRRKPDSA